MPFRIGISFSLVPPFSFSFLNFLFLFNAVVLAYDFGCLHTCVKLFLFSFLLKYLLYYILPFKYTNEIAELLQSIIYRKMLTFHLAAWLKQYLQQKFFE